MKRSLFAALAVASVSFTPAAAAPNSPELVVDVGTGQVIYADEATRPWYPASTTKMMTAYVALRAVKAGLMTMDTPLIASARAAGQKPSKIGIRPGQEITLDNALKILMVKSANDLAVVIAEGVAGSIPGFAQMMNNEARRLGMRETNFVNPHGFHDPNHYTSARDLAILARTMLFEFPEYREYWGIGGVRLGNKVMRNTNGLIGRYPGATGFKTGFVCASGFNLVGLADQGGRQVLAVVLGASSGAERTIRAAGLLDKGLSSWGGSYGSLTGLASVGGTPPNMRGAICTGRRMSLLTEEDTGGAIMGSAPTGDNSSVYAVGGGAPSASASTRVGGLGGGRVTLGPRAETAPLYVHLGRVAGSTAVARGPGNGAVNGVRNTATAFAPQPASATATAAAARSTARPAPVRPKPVEDDEDETAAPTQAAAAGTPMRLLPGAISRGGPGSIGLRSAAPGNAAPKPGAIERSAGGKPAQARPGAIAAKPEKAGADKASVKTAKADAKSAAAKTTDRTKTSDKAKAAASTPAKKVAASAKASAAKAAPAKAAAGKPAPKAKAE